MTDPFRSLGYCRSDFVSDQDPSSGFIILFITGARDDYCSYLSWECVSLGLFFCRKSWIIANIYVLCFISFFLILEMSYKDRTVLPIGCYISYSRYFGLYRRVCKAFTFFYSWLFWVCIIYCWDSLSYCYFSFNLSGTSFRLSIHNLVLSSLGGI